jgi:putative zinc finger/helix-turn-helix YgiT family protein
VRRDIQGEDMKKGSCSECGADARVIRGSYPFKESGLNVVLHGVEIVKCDKCGNEEVIIPRVNDLMRTIAFAIVGKPYGLRGEEVRFLRKYLQMTGDQFSRLLHVDRTTLSKWENNDDNIGEQSDLLIRSIALALGDGLKQKVEQMVRDFEKIRKPKRPVQFDVNAETQEYQYA